MRTQIGCCILNYTAQAGCPKETRSEGIRKRMDILLYGSTKISYRMMFAACAVYRIFAILRVLAEERFTFTINYLTWQTFIY